VTGLICCAVLGVHRMELRCSYAEQMGSSITRSPVATTFSCEGNGPAVLQHFGVFGHVGVRLTRVENEIRYPCGREQSKHRQKKAEIPELKRKGRNGAKEYMEHEWKRRKQCASVGCLPLAQCQCLTVTHTWTATLLRVLTGRSSIRVRVPNSESLHYQPVSVSVQEEERERRKFKTAMELM
jgi:hypothetical protein